MTTAPKLDPDTISVLGRDEGQHLHFLNHLATVKATAGETGSMTAVEFVQPRGFGPPLHSHRDEDELVIVLEGEVAFRSGDTEMIGTTGSTAYLPHGIPHTFQVLSDTARMMSVTAAASATPRFDKFVETLGEPTNDAVLPEPGEIDPGEVAMAGDRFGINTLGPPPAPLAG